MSLAKVGWTQRAVALGLVLAGLVAALGVLMTGRHLSDLEAEVTARGAAADTLAAVGSTLRSALEEAPNRTDPTGRRILFELAEDYGVPADTAVRARDTGRALLDESGVVVTAVYSTPEPPDSVAARRATVTALYIAPLRLQGTIARLRPHGGGVVVAGPERVVASAPGAAPDGTSSHSVEVPPVLAPDWTVTVWAPSQGVTPLAWTTAATLAFAGLVAAALLVRRAVGAARTDDELRRLRVQSTTVAGVAAVAQRSLDLADVLPAVATQLSEALGLRGLTLTAPGPVGDRPFFVAGEPVTGAAAPDLTPATLAAGLSGGCAVTLPLSRGGRMVARMHLLTGRDLDEHDVATLSAVAEILSSALANAEAFARQRELVQRLRAVDELKTVFLATASHELRTPVGVISGFARLLSTKVDQLTPDQLRAYADRVDSNAQQLAALVENLLDFSRLERGVGVDRADQSDLDLGVAVDRILGQHSDLTATHALVRQLAPGVLVAGTEHAVERVLTNLVGNAAKYSPAGTTIRVQVRERDGRAELVVDDEGPGVPVADREQVFSRFFRGRGDAVVKTRGAGLGLAIVREFAATMRGEVFADAAPSGGARFLVSYPLVAAEQPVEGESHVAS